MSVSLSRMESKNHEKTIISRPTNAYRNYCGGDIENVPFVSNVAR